MHKSAFLSEINEDTLRSAVKLGLNSVAVFQENLSKEKVAQIRSTAPGVEIHAVVSVFAGNGLIQRHPDAVPVDSQGKVDPKNWYGGACPSHLAVRKEALENVRKTSDLGVDGVWLDSIHYPTKWSSAEPEVLDVCYCERCLKAFEEYVGEPLKGVGGEGTELENLALHIDGSYYHEWLEFKAGQIVSFVQEAKLQTKKLGVFAVPWKDKEYGAGIQRVLAQDFSKLISHADMFIPMLYHRMLGKEVSWVGEMVDYFWQLGKPFIPAVESGPEISVAEFQETLTNASKSPSMGFCVFFLESLIFQPDKFDVAAHIK